MKLQKAVVRRDGEEAVDPGIGSVSVDEEEKAINRSILRTGSRDLGFLWLLWLSSSSCLLDLSC